MCVVTVYEIAGQSGWCFSDIPHKKKNMYSNYKALSSHKYTQGIDFNILCRGLLGSLLGVLF